MHCSIPTFQGRTSDVIVREGTDGSTFLVEAEALTTRLDRVPFGYSHLKRNKEQTSDLVDLQFHPATVVHLDLKSDDCSAILVAKIRAFRKDHDFEDAFLTSMVLASSSELYLQPTLDGRIWEVLDNIECRSVFFLEQDQKHMVPEGPYYIRGRKLHRTWKLFPDLYEAFQLPTVQELHSDKFKGITHMQDGKLMIPIPSRLHFTATSEKPLNGMRVTVKDIIDLKGVKTSGQSRAYERLYGPRSQNAKFISLLVNLGAIVIGKTKCTQFASSDQPTADWVDYHCPWNPRGDGYLSPRGSSTGTCVALAGYDWVDLGVGSDTGGSIRGPAAVMGLFAIRPTQVVGLMDNIMGIIHNIDVPGLVCREAELLHAVTKLTLEQTIPTRSSGNTPTKLLYPTDYWDQWPENSLKSSMEAFVQNMERFLGITRTRINLAQLWIVDDPAGDGNSIQSFLKDTFMSLLWKGYFDNFQNFREDYEKQYGVRPYVDPVMNYCWKRGAQISPEQAEDAQSRKQVYMDWMRNNVLGGNGFNTIMVFPVGDQEPFYRDNYRRAPDDAPPSYDWDEREDHQASLAGIPCIVVPVNQVSNHSKVTGKQMELPVSVSLMSGAATDTMLTKLVWDMARNSHVKGVVKTGERAF